MKASLLTGMILLGILFNANLLKAEDEAVATIDEDLEYTYGSIINSSPAEIIVSEYNYETDEEVQMMYILSPETKFSNVAGATNLVKDDNVDIYYKVTGGKKIAAMVTKDDTVYESEVAEGEDVIDDFSDDDVDPQTNSVNEVPAIVPGNEINE